jgi:hypothetical protein
MVQTIMKNLGKINVAGLMIALCLLTGFCVPGARAGEAGGPGSRPLSISELKKEVTAPRIYWLRAYVIHKDDECPPCPPNAVCETCVLGIEVADENLPWQPGIPMENVLYLRTPKAGEFVVGNRYLFKLRYLIELNAAGAWLQSGPQLIEYESE